MIHFSSRILSLLIDCHIYFLCVCVLWGRKQNQDWVGWCRNSYRWTVHWICIPISIKLSNYRFLCAVSDDLEIEMGIRIQKCHLIYESKRDGSHITWNGLCMWKESFRQHIDTVPMELYNCITWYLCCGFHIFVVCMFVVIVLNRNNEQQAGKREKTFARKLLSVHRHTHAHTHTNVCWSTIKICAKLQRQRKCTNSSSINNNNHSTNANPSLKCQMLALDAHSNASHTFLTVNQPLDLVLILWNAYNTVPYRLWMNTQWM